jgi:hypothetical protein
MKYRWLSLAALAALIMLFAGCSKPDTPQQVATEFWQAVAAGNASDAVELSTLVDTGSFEGFQGDMLNTLPEFGRVVIEADQATINTIMATKKAGDEAAATTRREITTYLLRVDDQWLVDYQRTREDLIDRSALSGLKGDISKLREQFDDAVGRSSEQVSEKLDQLAKDFETYSEETGKKADQVMKSLGESLENLRERLKESIDDAQKERQKSEEPTQESLEQAAI